MPKSKDYIEGFKAALYHYSWIDNFKKIKVGLPGIPISVAVKLIEGEQEPETKQESEKQPKDIEKGPETND